jgi:spore coat polysaccharide biosynthesis predicted glycosyltransferase SpsG
MYKAVFRVDGSYRIGLGHIMRCLIFAKAFAKGNIQPLFIIRDFEPQISSLIRASHFHVQTIPNTFSPEEDAATTTNFLNQNASSFLITDLINTDNVVFRQQYERYCSIVLRITQSFTIAFEDDVSFDQPFDIKIIPYYGIIQGDLILNKKTKLLLGPEYFIFQEDFIEASRSRREINRKATNILVTMGGCDPFNLTGKVADSINKLKNVSEIHLKVVIGPGFHSRSRKKLQEILEKYVGKYEIVLGANDGIMASLMLWSDLVITAGGLTKYEAAVTGTPCIVLAPFPREVEMSKKFAEAGTCLHLDITNNILNNNLNSMIETVLRNHNLRKEMSIRGKKLVDGKGLERIMSQIPNQSL